jgi:hypothetical protein
MNQWLESIAAAALLPSLAAAANVQARGIVLPMACVGLADSAKLVDGAIVDVSFGKTVIDADGSASSHVRNLYDRRRDVTDDMAILLMLRSVQEMEHWVGAHQGASVVGWVKHSTTPALQVRRIESAKLPLVTHVEARPKRCDAAQSVHRPTCISSGWAGRNG